MNTPKELFANVRKSIRLLFEYQKRMQGTMFHIKSVLNLSPAGRIEVNKLFSRAPRVSKDYGETQLSDGNWAWDYLYPMAMEYYLGEKKIENYDFACLLFKLRMMDILEQSRRIYHQTGLIPIHSLRPKTAIALPCLSWK